jgi:fluoride exporter
MNEVTSWQIPIAIAIGAIAGALSRYYFVLFAKIWWDNSFLGIAIVNLSGCLAIGFISELVRLRVSAISPLVYTAIVTGFLGAYTTFSTFALDTLVIGKTHSLSWAIFYACGSTIGGIIFARIGQILASLK